MLKFLNVKKIAISLALLATITACSGPLSSSGVGFLVTNTIEGQAANNDVKISKKGESCQYTILGLVATGNSSVKEAKAQGHIKRVATIDRSYFGVLGLFGKSCLIVRGE